MAGMVDLRGSKSDSPPARRSLALTEPPVVRGLLLAIALGFLGLFLLLPLVAVFVEGFRKGAAAYAAALTTPDALAAVKLTLLAALIAVTLNLAFGLAAAWAITKFEFRGRNLAIVAAFSATAIRAGSATG